MGSRPTQRSRLRWPAPTVRLRLTALYGVTFLLTGALLLTIGYALVRHNVDGRPDFGVVLRQRGLAPPGAAARFFGRSPRGPTAHDLRVAEEVRSQLRASALHRLLGEYVLALLAMTVVSVAAGWILAGRALAPLRKITATARRVSGENLGERIDLGGPADELRELADTFDRMLGRLDATFASQRHFVGSASHELRTPLAIMRTEVDVALADPEAGVPELRAMGEAVRETIDRCERLIESLLMLARSEAHAGREQPVDLRNLAADCVTDLQRQAREAGIEVITDLEPAVVLGEPPLLERMIDNLVENGIRHNCRGGTLSVRTAVSGGQARIEVGNGGEVIDPAVAATLTEPFARVDRSREGFGLGLSIVRRVCEAHGGRLLLHAPPEGGLEVTAILPAGEGTGANIEFLQRTPALTES